MYVSTLNQYKISRLISPFLTPTLLNMYIWYCKKNLTIVAKLPAAFKQKELTW